MKEFLDSELEEARRAIVSLVSKCEKVKPKLKEGSAQKTLLENRLKAFDVALELIERALAERG